MHLANPHMRNISCGILRALDRAHEILVGAYAEQGHSEETLQNSENMHCEHISPNATTLTCSLKACGSIGARTRGEHLSG